MKSLTSHSQFSIGRFTVDLFQAGSFLVDGGALFGGLPPEIWTDWIVPDERNRVRIPCWGCLVRGADVCVLTEPGAGWMGPKDLESYAQPDIISLKELLPDLGIQVEDVSDVILTHLHYDHCGGVFEPGADGQVCNIFPMARFHIQEWELSYAHLAGPWERNGYDPQLLDHLDRHTRICRWSGPFPLIEGLSVHISRGHTPCLQWLKVSGEGQVFAHLSDMIPTQWHLRGDIASAYDAYPGDLCREKEILLQQAYRDEYIISCAHDPEFPALQLHSDKSFAGVH